MTVFYTQVNALLSYHQKSFLLKQVETDTQADSRQTVRDFGTLSPKQVISIKFLTLGLGQHCRKGGAKKCKHQKGRRIPSKRGPVYQQNGCT